MGFSLLLRRACGPLKLIVRLEFELQSELEITLRILAAESGVRDASRVRVRTGRVSEEGVRLVEIHVIEQIHRLDAEFQFFRLRKPELLEQRCVGAPVLRPAQRVSLQIAESPNRRFCKDGRIEEPVSRPARVRIADYVRAIRACIRDPAGVVTDVERQPALNRRV